jgi:hypothetical protein
MAKLKKRSPFLALVILFLLLYVNLFAQRTQIRGFVDVSAGLAEGKVGFGFGEQDLFITSELNDDFSFLGETVFKYSPGSPTEFNVSVERVIVTYNFRGNHNLLVGKHHTPINYWNDTYHHGRVFFPTIFRPLLFSANTIPIHTTGIAVQGFNLGKLKFGYNLMVGNGIGSGEVTDNDKYKSVTAAIHIKPANNLQIGASFYSDVISEGAEEHGHIFDEKINQHLYTGTIAYFGSKFEFLAEGTLASNNAESTGNVNSFTSYAYAGIKLKEKWIPYVRFDYLKYQDDEIFFEKDDTTSFLVGLRYEISYLIVVKMEYQHDDSEVSGNSDVLNAQIAIGF